MLNTVTTFEPPRGSSTLRSTMEGRDIARDAFASTVLFATATPKTLKWFKSESAENDGLTFKVSPRVDDCDLYSTWTFTKGGFLKIKQRISFMQKYSSFIKYTKRENGGPSMGIHARRWRMTWYQPNPSLNPEILAEYKEEVMQMNQQNQSQRPLKKRKIH